MAYENGVFVVRYALDSNGAPQDPAGVFTGSDAGSLGLDAASGAALHAGHAAEEPSDAIAAISTVDSNWSLVLADTGITTASDLQDLANAVIGLDRKIAVLDTIGTGELVANETTSLGASLSALQSADLAVHWSETRDGKAASIAGFYAGTVWTARRSLRNVFGKSLPGTRPDRITEAQRAELARKRLNAYAYVGQSGVEIEGWTTGPGVWIDQRFAVYWLEWAIQHAVWAYMMTAHGGRHRRGYIRHSWASSPACVMKASRNGTLAPGQLTAAATQDVRDATRNPDFDGQLPRGYLVHAPRAVDRSETDRASRRLTGITVWASGSEFINGISIGITFT